MSDTQVSPTIDRPALLDRIVALRAHIRDEVGMAAMAAEPTKVCARLILDLLDGLNGLEALLRR